MVKLVARVGGRSMGDGKLTLSHLPGGLRGCTTVKNSMSGKLCGGLQ